MLLVGDGVRLVLRFLLDSLVGVVLDVSEDIVESVCVRLSPDCIGVCCESLFVDAWVDAGKEFVYLSCSISR